MVGNAPFGDDDTAGSGLDDQDLHPLTPATRVCADGASNLGIDVSHHQGTIDWAQVHHGGVRFAFIRVSDGTTTMDREFANNWSGSQAAGIPRGIYQFFRPNQSATAQAKIVIDALRASPGDLPPVIDVEVTGGMAPSAVAAAVRTWVDAVSAATGRTPIIYTGKYFWRDQVGDASTFGANPLWIAAYTSACPDIPDRWSAWTFWQSSGSGTMSGISGPVDIDHFNGTLATLHTL